MRNLLGIGDEVRVISPSYSGTLIPEDVWQLAITRLNDLGLKVTFGKHFKEVDLMESSSIKSRLEDLHDAFADSNVKGILCAIGGYNSNFLLDQIDWKLIKDNPKFFGGMSDITVLGNAIYAMTGMTSYQTPNFRNFGQKLGFDYSLNGFTKMAMSNKEVEIRPAKVWSDDKWTKNQDKRKFIKNEGWWLIKEGTAKGMTIGGNLCSLNLLQGTKYLPEVKGKLLFIEDDDLSTAGEFSRNLRSLFHLPGAVDVAGLVLGRFQKKTNLSREQLELIIADIPELTGKPILANVDFGHTDPKITWMIGGEAKVEVKSGHGSLVLV